MPACSHPPAGHRQGAGVAALHAPHAAQRGRWGRRHRQRDRHDGGSAGHTGGPSLPASAHPTTTCSRGACNSGIAYVVCRNLLPGVCGRRSQDKMPHARPAAQRRPHPCSLLPAPWPMQSSPLQGQSTTSLMAGAGAEGHVCCRQVCRQAGQEDREERGEQNGRHAMPCRAVAVQAAV